MLSIDSISDPSCSNSKATSAAVKSDGKGSDLVAAAHEEQSQLPNFSIRDYVCKSRRKDIRINWPFHEQLLQLCLDNGISDLLPPFEPPSTVRAGCLKREVKPEQLPICSENKAATLENGEEPEVYALLDSSLPLDSSPVVNPVQFPVKRREYCKVHQERNPGNRHTRSVSDINSSSVTSHNDLIGEISGELLLEKKFRSAVKLCSGAETSKHEELVSNSTVVSDPMASKVCPVCKLFASTSNTTLNAHIDQCLSSDQCNATRDGSELARFTVKPRKKRLMVDIYTTALHCTLEDLDRRNGTNWATNMSLVSPANPANITANGVDLEIKRTRFLPSAIEGKVGDIYVDSNGTKLLILSKVNIESPPLVTRKNFKLKKHGKVFKEGRSCLLSKKKSFKPSCSRFMNDNPQTRKLCAFKGFDEIEAAFEGDDMTEAQQENEEPLALSFDARDQTKNSEPATLGHWVCSKRSDLSRKNIFISGRELLFQHTQPQLDHAMNLASSSKHMVAPKTKRMRILSNSGESIASGKKSSPQPPKLDSNLLLEDNHATNFRSTDKSHHLPLKARKTSTLFSTRTYFSHEEREVDKREKFVTHKIFRKLRSILGGNKCLEGEKTDVADRVAETSGIQRCKFSEDQERGSLGMADDSMRGNVTVAPIPATNLYPIREEHAEYISRDESIQTESPAQRSTSNQEVHSREVINNEVIISSGYQAEPIVQHPHEEFQTETPFSQEPNSLVGHENVQENSTTTTSRTVQLNHDDDMILDMELSSDSPVSTTTAVCPPSPVDGKMTNSEPAQFMRTMELAPLQEKLSSMTVRKDNKNAVLSPTVREPSCSCSESLSRESQFSSPSRIKPSALSSFQRYPSLDSHTESVVTMDSPKSSVQISDSCSCTRTQPASNPILRLMGKDLVVSKEEPLKLPTCLPYDSDYSSSTSKFISFGVPSHVGFTTYNNYNYQIHAAANQNIRLQPLLPFQRSDKLNIQSQCITEGFSAPPQQQLIPIVPSYNAREVIVIDDDSHKLEPEPRKNFISLPQTVQNPNFMAPQMPFACFPVQKPYASRAVQISQRQNAEGSFVFPSSSSLYFSQTLR